MIKKTSETRPLAGNIVSQYTNNQISAYSSEYINGITSYPITATPVGKDGNKIIYRQRFSATYSETTDDKTIANDIENIYNFGGWVQGSGGGKLGSGLTWTLQKGSNGDLKIRVSSFTHKAYDVWVDFTLN